ncbi:MAG: hypothetical protein HZB61_07670 [Nitrospirae bacterium]|nr:hypothetical protein [Nitrospirota bacterium]
MIRRRLLIISILLPVITVFMSYPSYNVWAQKPADMPGIENKAPVGKGEAVLNGKPDDSIVGPSSKTPIPSAETVPSSVTAAKLPKLFGTIIRKDKKIAIIDDPFSETTGIYTINDSLAGFVISDIQQDRVILLRGNKKTEIRLRDPKDVQSAPPLSLQTHKQSPGIKVPARPIPPPGSSLTGVSGIKSQFTSEESLAPEESEGQSNSEYTHPRFSRRPVHEDLPVPLTPIPPIKPTFK